MRLKMTGIYSPQHGHRSQEPFTSGKPTPISQKGSIRLTPPLPCPRMERNKRSSTDAAAAASPVVLVLSESPELFERLRARYIAQQQASTPSELARIEDIVCCTPCLSPILTFDSRAVDESSRQNDEIAFDTPGANEADLAFSHSACKTFIRYALAKLKKSRNKPKTAAANTRSLSLSEMILRVTQEVA